MKFKAHTLHLEIFASATQDTNRVRVSYGFAGPFASMEGKAAREAFIQTAPAEQRTYSVAFTVPKTLRSPVFLYFELSGFFGAYRRYVRSRNEDQVHGDSGSSPSCNPIRRFPGLQTEILPCGLVAWSVFNDTFTLRDVASGAEIPLDESREAIAWEGDYSGALKVFKE